MILNIDKTKLDHAMQRALADPNNMYCWYEVAKAGGKLEDALQTALKLGMQTQPIDDGFGEYQA